MQKKSEQMRIIRIISGVLDAITLMYFVSYMYWIFAVLDKDSHILSDLFIKVNPMTVGTYCMGLFMILHLIAFRNPIGRCVICIPYILSLVVSFIATMGMTGWNDLIMYAPHILIIGLAITIMVKQKKDKLKILYK